MNKSLVVVDEWAKIIQIDSKKLKCFKKIKKIHIILKKEKTS